MVNEIGLKEIFKAAKQSHKQGNIEQARDIADFAIRRIAEGKELGFLQDGDEIEGVRIDLWLTRFWVFLENNNLLLS